MFSCLCPSDKEGKNEKSIIKKKRNPQSNFSMQQNYDKNKNSGENSDQQNYFIQNGIKQQFDEKIKILMLSGKEVGSSTLLKNLKKNDIMNKNNKNQEKEQEEKKLIESETIFFQIDSKKVKVIIYDIPCLIKFKKVILKVLPQCQAIIYVYGRNDMKSLHKVYKFSQLVKELLMDFQSGNLKNGNDEMNQSFLAQKSYISEDSNNSNFKNNNNSSICFRDSDILTDSKISVSTGDTQNYQIEDLMTQPQIEEVDNTDSNINNIQDNNDLKKTKSQLTQSLNQQGKTIGRASFGRQGNIFPKILVPQYLLENKCDLAFQSEQNITQVQLQKLMSEIQAANMSVSSFWEFKSMKCFTEIVSKAISYKENQKLGRLNANMEVFLKYVSDQAIMEVKEELLNSTIQTVLQPKLVNEHYNNEGESYQDKEIQNDINQQLQNSNQNNNLGSGQKKNSKEFNSNQKQISAFKNNNMSNLKVVEENMGSDNEQSENGSSRNQSQINNDNYNQKLDFDNI
ncbi:P-loop containing nucleoside triphosphate hydrolase [Pseudocohnilembus persalinus]|uniref:p-loop containing nucleoside triphosphate hydrolase n=1 Tax=Pseudocohnilembus persalinus TaxID=266149 RepID=A0A0V0QV32_PSEPJ|nr:P-loop containing nucleoside triphosphate hydrolase [Pseudocohnilembus persalinus]|eukprot:KRX06146.1 P-loop containing nucleoside triphosphate hydrolase [Pseudocohnilembus persalinus]